MCIGSSVRSKGWKAATCSAGLRGVTRGVVEVVPGGCVDAAVSAAVVVAAVVVVGGGGDCRQRRQEGERVQRVYVCG
jgi:hypothetical protein